MMQTTGIEIVRRRAVIETHVERCRDAAADKLLEMGRWLNAAKTEGVVPHGEWSAWVREHAGVNERTAQRLMRAARELPEGSPLARLEMTKINSLLALPAEEREAAAREMDAEHLSSREVEDRVRAIRAERDEALRVMGAQKEAAARREHALALVQRERDQKDKEILQLRERLRIARTQTPPPLPDPEKDRQLRTLEAQLREKTAQLQRSELEIDRLSDALDAAKTDAMRAGYGAETDEPPSLKLVCAIGSFMTQAGGLVAPLEQMASTMTPDARAVLAGQAQLVGQLAMRVIAACGGDMDA